MRRELREEDNWEIGAWADWPEPEPDLDDDAFARAIEEGRRLEAAA